MFLFTSPDQLRNSHIVKSPNSKSIKVTMSLKPHLHAFGTEEGRVTGLGFSGYVSSLIIQDLRSRGDAGKISRLFSPAESPARPHPLPSVADVRRRPGEFADPLVGGIGLAEGEIRDRGRMAHLRRDLPH